MSAAGASLIAASTAGAASPGPAASEKTRMRKAAVDFEAVLLGQWLDGAEHSFATVPGSEEDDDAGGEQIRSFAMQSLSHALAARDTLGIARLVEHGLEQASGGAGAKLPEPPSAAAQGVWRAKPLAGP